MKPSGWAAWSTSSGCNAALFRGSITFKEDLEVERLRWGHEESWIGGLRLLRNAHWFDQRPMRLVLSQGGEVREIDPTEVNLWGSPGYFEMNDLDHGDWFAFYSPEDSNSHLFVNRGGALQIGVIRPPSYEWVSVWAKLDSPAFSAGQEYDYELFSVGYPLDVPVNDPEVFAEAVAYLEGPEGFELSRGRRIESPGLIELEVDNHGVELSVPRPGHENHLILPVLINGFNRRWSTGLWQIDGYVKGDYGSGQNRYRPVGLDLDGRAYVPLHVNLADRSHVVVGHPVKADDRGRDLFIQVTALSGGTDVESTYRWYVAVNNPTDEPITTVLSRNINLPDLNFGTREITLASGEHRVLHHPKD